MPYWPPGKNRTNTDQSTQIENSMCSQKIEKIRLRQAIFDPFSDQKVGSSGRQSSIQRPFLRTGTAVVLTPAGAVTVIAGSSVMWSYDSPSPMFRPVPLLLQAGNITRTRWYYAG